MGIRWPSYSTAYTVRSRTTTKPAMEPAKSGPRTKPAQSEAGRAAKRPNKRTQARYYDFLRQQCDLLGLPVPVSEFRFDPKRRWRFDFAYEKERFAIEIDGGVWKAGRHTRGSGFVRDLEKMNAATLAGWRVFRYTPEQLANWHTAFGIKAFFERLNAGQL